MLLDHISDLKGSFSAYTELRAQINERFIAELSDDAGLKEHFYANSGVCARVLRNGVYGLASSSDYNAEEAVRVLRAAEKNAEAMGKYVRRPVAAIPALPNAEMPLNYPVKSIDKAFLKDLMNEVQSYAKRKYPSVSTSISCESKYSEKLLVVHSGVSGRSNIVLGTLSVHMSKTVDGEEHFAYDTFAIDKYFNDCFSSADELFALVDGTHDKLLKTISYSKDMVAINGGTHEVILSPDFTGMLAHEAVGHTCEADAVLCENSVCAAYMGKQVASELVSLTDFHAEAYGEHCPIHMLFDDEGTPCVDAPIIKDGILVGCMTNRDAAVRLGVPNTGNARASEFSDEPIIRMRNTCFHKGESKLDDMIASIDDGYYLVRSGGGNGSLKGEFNMFIDEGYEIKHGKLARKIYPTLSSGIAWDALKTVTMVSDHFVDSKSCGICGKKQAIPTSQGGPEMKLRLTISGK